MGKGSSKGRIKYTGVMQTKDMDDLSQYMDDHYGVSIDKNSFSKIDFNTTKTVLNAVETMLSEFPGIDGHALKISATLKGNNAYAGTTVDGKVMIHPKMFSSAAAAKAAYEEDLAAGYHPKGTDYSSTLIHEMGHQIEAELLRRRYPGSDKASVKKRSEEWRKGTIASDLVGKALDKVAPAWRENRKVAADQVNRISRYAASDVSETLAEAIADYHANGRKAAPLSKELWRLAKLELG